MAANVRAASPRRKAPSASADRKLGKTGGRRSAKHRTGNGAAQAVNGRLLSWSTPVVDELFGEERVQWQRLIACEFLEMLRPGGPWVLTALVPDGAIKTSTVHTGEEVKDFIRQHNGTRNLYYAVNPLWKEMTLKAEKTDVDTIEYTLADLDPANGETPEAAKARYLKQLETFQPRPTAVVDSGNGIQCLWRLEERVKLGNVIRGKKGGKLTLVFSPENQAAVDDVEERTACIMKRLGAKAGTQNIDRILRLPGTMNLPNAAKKEAGRVPCQTGLLWFEDTAYPLDAFPNVADLIEAGGNEQQGERDESGSGYGFRFMQDRRAEGMSYEQAREAIMADEDEAGEWANRVDERQRKRAYERCMEERGAPADIKHSGELFDPWTQFVVPEFPLIVLPPVAQEFVTTQSEVIGVDQASMAMCVLSAFSGALSHVFSLKMMRHGDWYVSPRLWVLLYGDASTKKTPTINAATQPLENHQKLLQHEYREAMHEYELARECADGDQKPSKNDKPEPPDRFVVYDTTIEKLGEILARNGKGLLVKRDEFSGWIGSMEKYGSRGASANRAFWLQAYDGGSSVVDRIGRGEIFIDNLSVSLVGGVQPERLAELQGLTSDGLLQRFLPTVMGPPKLPQDRPTNTQEYERLVESLIDAKSNLLTLGDPALEVMGELQKHLHDLASTAGGLARGLQSFVMKLSGVAGNLALILHMAADPKRRSALPVSRNTMEDVSRLVIDFILPHAFEFYRSVEAVTEGDRLKRLASWVLTNGKTRFVVSDLTSNVADFRGLSLFEVNKRVSPLVATGWLREGQRGPENRVWNVDQRVFSQFAARGKEEEARKVKLAALMNSPRKKKEQ